MKVYMSTKHELDGTEYRDDVEPGARDGELVQNEEGAHTHCPRTRETEIEHLHRDSSGASARIYIGVREEKLRVGFLNGEAAGGHGGGQVGWRTGRWR